MVVPMGDFNIKAEELEVSGLLRSLGLTLIRPENSKNTCTSGKGLCVDYALVTTGYVETVISVKVVKAVPWGPHYGLRIRVKTRITSLTVREIVRPRPIEEAVEQLRKIGLVEDNKDETPRISWAEAKKQTRRMVERALKKKQPEVQEYADDRQTEEHGESHMAMRPVVSGHGTKATVIARGQGEVTLPKTH